MNGDSALQGVRNGCDEWDVIKTTNSAKKAYTGEGARRAHLEVHPTTKVEHGARVVKIHEPARHIRKSTQR